MAQYMHHLLLAASLIQVFRVEKLFMLKREHVSSENFWLMIFADVLPLSVSAESRSF